MAYLSIILTLTVIWINGCASARVDDRVERKPRTMMDVYSRASGQAKKDVSQFVENNLRQEKTFGYVKPYIPVMNEPVVRKVWIPDHKSKDNPDVMIAGHWNYMVIQAPSWFIDHELKEAQIPIIVPTKQDSKQDQNDGHQNKTIREDI